MSKIQENIPSIIVIIIIIFFVGVFVHYQENLPITKVERATIIIKDKNYIECAENYFGLPDNMLKIKCGKH